jgi:nuclear pore complex protein Nup93
MEIGGSGEFKDTPIWAMIFYLLRMGKGREALGFASSIRDDLERLGDGNLIEYLTYWVGLMDNPDSTGDRALRDQIASEFNQRIRIKNGTDAAGKELGDPFKLAVYKILGRCELSKKMIPGPYVIVGTEDYVWLQLVLSQEQAEGDTAVGEPYGLRDVARHFLRFGPEYFNPQANQGNPLIWFMVLLACGEFERACHYLSSTDRYGVEAVHFAVALGYAGTLRFPDSPLTVESDLISEQEVPEPSSSLRDPPPSAFPSTPTASSSLSRFARSQQPAIPLYRLAYFDFARMMHQYTRSFYRTDPSKALQYLYLVCMYGRLPAGDAREAETRKADAYNALAHRYIRDVVLDTRDYGALLGTVRSDGSRVPGQLEKFSSLLNLPTSAAFIANITKKAAEKAERDGGRFNDAVQLYNLAEEYDTVVRIVNKYLGETLAQRQFAVSGVGADASIDAFGRPTASPFAGVGTAAIEEALRIASDLTAYYDNNPALSAKVTPSERETCTILTALLKFMQNYEEAKLDAALQIQIDIGLLPLDVRDRANRADSAPSSAEMVSIREKALNVSNLNENVLRSLPMIIIATMDCLYRLWKGLRSSSFQDPTRAAAGKEYKMMADNIVMFAGQMEFRMSPDNFSKINRLAVVYMS